MQRLNKNSASIANVSLRRRWWSRITNKTASEIMTELMLLVMGSFVMLSVDLVFLSRAPVAFQYLFQLLIYLNHHAVAAVELIY